MDLHIDVYTLSSDFFKSPDCGSNQGRKAAGPVDPVHQFVGVERVLAGGQGALAGQNVVQEVS